MVCSTPHALRPDALSPCTLSPRALSCRALSPNGLRNILKNQASQVEFFYRCLSKTVFITSFMKETGLAPELFTRKHIFIKPIWTKSMRIKRTWTKSIRTKSMSRLACHPLPLCWFVAAEELE